MWRLTGVAAVAGGLTLIGGLVVAGGPLCRHALPSRLTDPGLALQLAASTRDVETVLGQRVWCPGTPTTTATPTCLANKTTLDVQQSRDLVFIPVYVAFLVLVGLLVWRHGAPGGRWLGLLAVVLALGAGLCDVQEDRIIRVLLGPAPVCTVMPRPWAVAKWRMLCAVLALNIPLFLADRGLRGVGRWAGYAAIVLGVAALYFGGMQLATGDDTYLESALPVVAAAVTATWVAVAGRAWFPAGLLPGLDTLGRSPWLSRLAAWPDDEGPGC